MIQLRLLAGSTPVPTVRSVLFHALKSNFLSPATQFCSAEVQKRSVQGLSSSHLRAVAVGALPVQKSGSRVRTSKPRPNDSGGRGGSRTSSTPKTLRQQPKKVVQPDSDQSTPESPPSVASGNGEETASKRATHTLLPKFIGSEKMRVDSATFVKSSANVTQCPPESFPEFAMLGRSNVGKSSIINMLVNQKSLAETSKKPGKTQLINHFLINNNWYLVDLPGYGFATAPGRLKEEWNEFTKEYFLNRGTLVAILLLVDASIPPQRLDLECANWLGENKLPVTIVFTKCDKRKKKHKGGKPPEENIADFEEQLSEVYEEPPPWIATSSVTKTGRTELLLHLAQLRKLWKTELQAR